MHRHGSDIHVAVIILIQFLIPLIIKDGLLLLIILVHHIIIPRAAAVPVRLPMIPMPLILRIHRLPHHQILILILIPLAPRHPPSPALVRCCPRARAGSPQPARLRRRLRAGLRLSARPRSCRARHAAPAAIIWHVWDWLRLRLARAGRRRGRARPRRRWRCPPAVRAAAAGCCCCSCCCRIPLGTSCACRRRRCCCLPMIACSPACAAAARACASGPKGLDAEPLADPGPQEVLDSCHGC